jgi:hypothetical protein
MTLCACDLVIPSELCFFGVPLPDRSERAVRAATDALGRAVGRDDLYGVVLHLEDATPATAVLAVLPGDLVHVVRTLVEAPRLRVLVSARAQAPVYAAGASANGEVLFLVPTEWVSDSVPFCVARHAARKL